MDARTGLPVVGMVGGGPAGRMMHAAAAALGQSLRLLVGSEYDAAARVAGGVRVGDLTDIAVLREFAAGCDVLTCCCDQVPGEHLATLAADGVAVRPGVDSVRRVRERSTVRGRARIAEQSGIGAVAGVAPGRVLAVVLARSPFGQVAAYPLVEIERHGGLAADRPHGGLAADGRRRGEEAYVLAPAPEVPAGLAVAAQRLAIDLAAALDVVGLLTVQFTVPSSRSGPSPAELRVTDVALGPHEAGYWTLGGAATSQYEQHLRAVLDYPLGAVATVRRALTTPLVAGGPGGMGIDERLHHAFAAEPGVKVHLYGVEPVPGRTIGHISVFGEDFDEMRTRASRASRWVREGRGDWSDRRRDHG